jgi:hypothetical protein
MKKTIAPVAQAATLQEELPAHVQKAQRARARLAELQDAGRDKRPRHTGALLQSSPSRSSATSLERPSRPRPRRPLFSSPPDLHTGTAVAKFHDKRDILRKCWWRALLGRRRRD